MMSGGDSDDDGGARWRPVSRRTMSLVAAIDVGNHARPGASLSPGCAFVLPGGANPPRDPKKSESKKRD